MLSLSSSHRYYLYREATDMRKSFDGLSGLIVGELDADTLSGDVFIFINRRRDRMKLLVWDRTGFMLFYKRLESGTFELPAGDAKSVELSWSELVMMLEGVGLRSIRHRKRYGMDKKFKKTA
jgi:transposase